MTTIPMLEVVIIGTSIAGLAAARELRLKQSCHNFVVLEAKETIVEKAQFRYLGDSESPAPWFNPYLAVLDKIKLSQRVIAIERASSSMRVITNYSSFLTRKVIVAVPQGILVSVPNDASVICIENPDSFYSGVGAAEYRKNLQDLIHNGFDPCTAQSIAKDDLYRSLALKAPDTSIVCIENPGSFDSGVQAAKYVGHLLYNELTQRFIRLGFKHYLEAPRLAKDHRYRSLTLKAPDNCAFDSIEMRTDIDTAYLTFRIHANNHMTLLSLHEILFPPNQWLGGSRPSFYDGGNHKHQRPLYDISIIFTLFNFIENETRQVDTPDSIQFMLNAIFDKLERSSSKDNSMISLQNMRRQALAFSEQYFEDFYLGFPDPKEVLRNPPPLHKRPVNDGMPQSKASRALHHAVERGDVDYVRQYLRQGGDPNLQYYNHPIFAKTLILSDNDERNDEALLTILDLFLEYGVNTQIGHNGWTTPFPYQTFEATLAKPNSRRHILGKEIIRRLQIFDNGRTFMLIPSSQWDDTNSVGYLVRQGQNYLANRNKIPFIIRCSETIKPLSRKLIMHDHANIMIETYHLDTVKNDISKVDQLLNIFRSQFEKVNKNEKKLREYFFEAITCNRGITLIDLIQKDDRILGFSISQWISVNKNHRPACLHRIPLAVAVRDIQKYRRLMTLLSFYRGFCTPSTEVLTVYESISLPSYLQAIGFDFYPQRFIELEWMTLMLKQFYSPEVRHWDNGYLYVRDELALFRNDRKQEPFYNRTALASKRLPEISKNGYALVVAFANTKHNTNRFQALLSESIEGENGALKLNQSMSKL